MNGEPFWLDVDDIVELNRGIVEDTGEPHVVRDRNLLAGAVDRPQTMWVYAGERDLAALAARLLLGIAANHPFVQGNKRTALTAAIAFFEANGCEVVDTEDDGTEGLARLVETAVASHDEDALCKGLRDYVRGPTLFSDGI